MSVLSTVLMLAGVSSSLQMASAQTAAYLGQPIGGGFNQPIDVKVDSAGNVYIADYGSNLVTEMPAGCTSASCVTPIGGGFTHPQGLWVDGSGNVYVADNGNQAVKEIQPGCTSANCVITLPGIYGGPVGVFADASGNVYVADEGGNAVREIPAGCSLNTCVATLGGGFTQPGDVVVDGSGNVYVAGYLSGKVQKIPPGCTSAGCVTTLGGGFNLPDDLAFDASGNLYIADPGNNTVKERSTTCASAGCVTSIYGGFSGPIGLTVDRGGNIFVADFNNNVVKKIVRQAVSLASTSVNSGTTQTLTFTIFGAGTLGVPSVVTQGVAGLDFTDQGTGTCTTNGTSYSYTENETCTVVVSFAPKHPGLHSGAVKLFDNTGNLLTSVSLSGTGTGPQVGFLPASSMSNLGTGLLNPQGIAVDASGNIFVADQGNGAVKEILAAGGYTTTNTLISNLLGPTSVAVDGSGNVFVADDVRIVEIFAATNYTTSTTFGAGGSNVTSVAVDGSGNLFFTGPDLTANPSLNYSMVAEISPVNGAYNGLYSTFRTLATGFSYAGSVAVDGSGNVFLVDSGNKQVKEIVAVNGSIPANPTIQVLGSGFLNPVALSLDGGGNVYVADETAGTVSKILAGGSYTTVVPIAARGATADLDGVAVDANGNVYYATELPSTITKLDLLDPPSLSFASTAVGQTSSDSPKLFLVQNNGNERLNYVYSGLAPNTDYQQVAGSGTYPDCTNSGSMLAAGAICNISVEFTPVGTGSRPGAVALSDDNLNHIPVVQQAISLSGNGIFSAASTTTSLSSSLNPSFASAPGTLVTFTATVISSSTVSEGTVTFSDGGNPISGCLNAAISGGTAFCNTTFTTQGVHFLKAVFNGDSNYSTSYGTLTQEVDNHTVQAGNQFCNTGAIILTPGATSPSPASVYPSKVFVAGLTSNVQSVTLSLNGITATNPQTTDLLLVGPTGAAIVPFAGVGNATGITNVNLTLSDAASSFLPSSSPLISGTFEPTSATGGNSLVFPAPAPHINAANFAATDGTATLTSTFGNTAPNGTWSLYSYESGQSGVAITGGWCVNITPVPATVAVPNVVGDTQSAAQAAITAAGLAVGTVTSANSNTVPVGEVVSESPSAGSQVAPNSTVSLVVSLGPAQFSLSIAASPTAGGTFTPTSGGTYTNGTAVNIVATPHAGYYFVNWTGSADIASPTSASTSITMNANESITANFAPNPYYVVTTNQDDAGIATNCTPQTTPGTGTDASCSLRDALAAASALAGVTTNISFDKTAFSPSNTVAQNTITESSAGTLTIPPGTTITGPATGTGVTIDGAGQYSVFTMNSGTAAIDDLTITDGAGTLVPGHGIFGGGIFFNQGTLTVRGCTLLRNHAGYGGAVWFSGGSVTFIDSTLTLNYASFNAGAIDAIGNVTLIGSTVSRNSAVYTAGGIVASAGSLNLYNSVVSGNSSGFDPDIYGGITDNGGNVIGSASINLSTPGSYGGPTQTALPLPGSSAICAGTLANAQAASLTTDQRGLPLDPNCPSGSVDAGAVQTSYALSFTTSPSSTQVQNVPLTPAPVLTLTENGSGLTAGSATLTVAAALGTLSGTTTAGTSTASASAGQASFSGLLIGSVESSDDLTGSLTLTAAGATPAVTLTAQSSNFVVNPLPATHFSVNAPSNATSGTSFNITVTALNSLNATATTYSGTVHFTSSDPNAQLPPNATLINGVGTFAVTLNTSGNQTISATDTSSPSVTGSSTSISVAATPLSSTYSSLSVSPSSSAAAGSTLNITAQVSDPNNNPIAGATVTFAATVGNTGTASTTASLGTASPTGVNGQTTVRLTDTVAESLTITAKVSGAGTGTIGTTVNFVAPNYVVTVATDPATGGGTPGHCVAAGLTGDNSNCSLRDAVAEANVLSGVTANIGFSLPSPSTILIAQSTPITMNRNVNINGPGANALTIEGGIAPYNGTTQTANYQILQINGNSNVSISGVTLANGYEGDENLSGGGAILGTGSGMLTITSSMFSGNQSQGKIGGGAISAPSVLVTNSTFSGNQAGRYGEGGAINVGDYGSATVINSTFSGNQAYDGGALIGPSMAVANSTFSGNQAAAEGGAIIATSLTVTNSVFTGDSAPSDTAIFSLGNVTVTNIVYNNETFYGVTLVNSVNADPKLSPLGYHGGTTQTFLPLPGSPAICTGISESVNNTLITTDQRGVAIPTTYGSTHCYDAGAVQTNYALGFTTEPPASLLPPNTVLSPAPAVTVTESGSALTAGPATVTVADADADLTSGSTLSATTSTAAATAGQAAFTNLLFNAPETGDTLTATLSLNPTLTTPLSLTALSGPFKVGQIGQAIKFTAPSTEVYGTQPITLTATGGASGNPVTFKVLSGPGSIIAPGSALTITGVGKILIEADQAGNAVYSAASPATQTISVTPALLTITAVNASRAYGAANPAFTYKISGLVNHDSASVVSGTATLSTTATSTSPVTTSPATTYPITFVTESLTALNYTFTYVPGTLTVTAATQSITFGPLPAVTYGVAPIVLGATATSGLPVSYTVSGPAKLGGASGNVLTVTGASTVIVTATEAGNADYAAARPIQQSFSVAQAKLTVTANPASRIYGAPNPAFTYTITGFVPNDTVSVVSGTATLASAATATSPVTTSPATTYPIVFVTEGLSAANYRFTYVPGALTVTAATQSITFNPLPNLTYGAAPITLGATASSKLPVTYQISGPAKLGGYNNSVLTITGTGKVTVTASQAGNADYSAARPVSQSFNVNPAILTVTANPASRVVDTANPAFTYSVTGFVDGDKSSVVAGSATLTTTATATSTPGTYKIAFATESLTATNYTFHYLPGTLTVTPAPPVLSIPSGNYYTGQTVALTLPTTDPASSTKVYYTTSGARPTVTSTLYTGPIAITASPETIEAIAVENGISSALVSATYTLSSLCDIVNYKSGFTSTGNNSAGLTLNNGAKLSGTALELTDGGLSEARSAFTSIEVPNGTFITNFTFQITDPIADGITFTWQTNSKSAVGGDGQALGYATMPNSEALKLDIYNDAGEGTDSTGFYRNGAVPTLPAINLSNTGINLRSGDIFAVRISYNGTVAAVTITDTATKKSYSFNTNIAPISSTGIAYVGFTSATGSNPSVAKILTWTYSGSNTCAVN